MHKGKTKKAMKAESAKSKVLSTKEEKLDYLNKADSESQESAMSSYEDNTLTLKKNSKH